MQPIPLNGVSYYEKVELRDGLGCRRRIERLRWKPIRPKANLCTLLGAGLGGLAGSQIGSGSGRLAAVAAGTLLGGFLGNEIGQSLDNADRLAASNAIQRSMEFNPNGRTTVWRNPDSGNTGSFTPTRTISNGNGQPCREYQSTVTVGGQSQQAFGTACRQADGSWSLAG